MVIPSSEFYYSAVLILIGLVWVKRILWVRAFSKTHSALRPLKEPVVPSPKVSIIVPARNEEKNIANCLYHLQKQNYPNYEIIVVDDRSTDKTPHLVNNFQKLSDKPFKIIRIEKSPEMWTGKNYAMFTGFKAATGEWILFTDADTTHRPESLNTAIDCALKKKIDLLTLSPETESRSFWEKTVQPLAVSSLALWFDPDKINDPSSSTVLANGQYILVKKSTYEAVGGNEAVRNEVVEDVALAKKVRYAGFLVQFLNGTRLYSTRMYSSLKEIKTGWTRIFTYLFNKNVFSILHKIFLFIVFSSLPFLVLIVEGIIAIVAPELFYKNLFFISLLVSSFIVTVRFVGNKMVKSSPWYALLHLLGSLVMIWILLACVGRILFNRPSVWRGDSYS